MSEFLLLTGTQCRSQDLVLTSGGHKKSPGREIFAFKCLRTQKSIPRLSDWFVYCFIRASSCGGSVLFRKYRFRTFQDPFGNAGYFGTAPKRFQNGYKRFLNGSRTISAPNDKGHEPPSLSTIILGTWYFRSGVAKRHKKFTPKVCGFLKTT